jgi:hypothetical protein
MITTGTRISVLDPTNIELKVTTSPKGIIDLKPTATGEEGARTRPAAGRAGNQGPARAGAGED